MIANQDITVVVQGPVQANPDRPQEEGAACRCLSSIREILPDARLILSTWPNQQLDGLDYDDLVISEDPGPNIVGYAANGDALKRNDNRQIISSREGLRRVESRYAMKLRADSFVVSDRFKYLQQAFPRRHPEHKFLKERVVISSIFTREYAKGLRVIMHPCDFFQFGLAADVLDIWDLPLFEDYVFDEHRSGYRQYAGAPAFSSSAEQDLCVRFVNKHLSSPISIRKLHDTSADLRRISNLYYANNVVVGSPADIGLGLPVRFMARPRRKHTITYLTHTGWRCLYRKYCDRDHPVENLTGFKVRLGLCRLAYLGPPRLLAPFRLLKRRFKRPASMT